MSYKIAVYREELDRLSEHNKKMCGPDGEFAELMKEIVKLGEEIYMRAGMDPKKLKLNFMHGPADHVFSPQIQYQGEIMDYINASIVAAEIETGYKLLDAAGYYLHRGRMVAEEVNQAYNEIKQAVSEMLGTHYPTMDYSTYQATASVFISPNEIMDTILSAPSSIEGLTLMLTLSESDWHTLSDAEREKLLLLIESVLIVEDKGEKVLTKNPITWTTIYQVSLRSRNEAVKYFIMEALRSRLSGTDPAEKSNEDTEQTGYLLLMTAIIGYRFDAADLLPHGFNVEIEDDGRVIISTYQGTVYPRKINGLDISTYSKDYKKISYSFEYHHSKKEGNTRMMEAYDYAAKGSGAIYEMLQSAVGLALSITPYVSNLKMGLDVAGLHGYIDEAEYYHGLTKAQVTGDLNILRKRYPEIYNNFNHLTGSMDNDQYTVQRAESVYHSVTNIMDYEPGERHNRPVNETTINTTYQNPHVNTIVPPKHADQITRFNQLVERTGLDYRRFTYEEVVLDPDAYAVEVYRVYNEWYLPLAGYESNQDNSLNLKVTKDCEPGSVFKAVKDPLKEFQDYIISGNILAEKKKEGTSDETK